MTTPARLAARIERKAARSRDLAEGAADAIAAKSRRVAAIRGSYACLPDRLNGLELKLRADFLAQIDQLSQSIAIEQAIGAARANAAEIQCKRAERTTDRVHALTIAAQKKKARRLPGSRAPEEPCHDRDCHHRP